MAVGPDPAIKSRCREVDEGRKGAIVDNNLTSLRFWVLPAVLGAILGSVLCLPLKLISDDLYENVYLWVCGAFALAIGIYLANPARGGRYFHCPACGKGLRTSKGGTTCHHCGYDTAAEIEATRAAAAAATATAMSDQEGPAAPVPLLPGSVAQTTVLPAAEPVRTQLADTSRTIELAVPSDVAWQQLKKAANDLTKVRRVSDTSRMLEAKGRYGLASVQLKLAVSPGEDPSTSRLEIMARGSDVWGVGSRKVVERLLLAMG